MDRLIGAKVQEVCKKNVSLNQPDINIMIEIVRGQAFIGTEKITGYGGLPNNTGETAISLLSAHRDIMDNLVEALIEEETIDRERFLLLSGLTEIQNQNL